jgi:hypothetical protein
MFAFSLMILFLLTGCAGPAVTQPAAEADLTVFRSPT